MRSSVMLCLGLVACVGDAPLTLGPDSGSDGAAPELDGAVTDTAQQPDVLAPCDGGTLARCNGSCVDVASTNTDCGQCGHDCGGAACYQGACQPMLVVDGLNHPVFDVDGASIYYSKDDKVLRCPSAGCKLTPTQLVAMTNPVYGSDDPNGTLMVGPNNFYFSSYPVQSTTRPTLYGCGLPTCTAPVVLRNSGLQGGLAGGFSHQNDSVYWSFYKDLESASCTTPNMCTVNGNEAPFTTAVNTLSPAADSAGVYFISPSNTLQSCPLAATCTPTTLNAGMFGSNKWSGSLYTSYEVLAVYNNIIYLLHTGDEGGIPHGNISTCPTSGCLGGVTLFTSKLPYPLLIAVDKDGVFWFSYDAGGNGDTAQIYTCPLSGCPGSGPTLVATKQTGTAVLHTDDKFVYWATATQIWRIAK